MQHALYLQQHVSAKHNSPQCPGEHPQQNFSSGFLGREGGGPKDIWCSCNSPTYKNSPKVIPVEVQMSVGQHYTEKQVTDSHAKFK